MKYETIGGAIHDTNHNSVTIRELRLGDKFKMKSGHIYRVDDEKCKWHSSGSSLKRCFNLNTSTTEYKRCNTTVIKVS